ncbi:MAG TPA: hypothetical protein VGF69_24035 [Thermoanaerobaculia bacterium]|jgi:hypothetical protein
MNNDPTPGLPLTTVNAAIDAFIASVTCQVSTISFSERASVWLMLELFQFSKRNPGLLIKGAEILGELDDQRMARTLFENYQEESTHPVIYQHCLMDYDINVDDRQAFPATDRFLDDLMSIITTGPSPALGALYATESAALMEHRILNELSRDLAPTKGIVYEESGLARFHGLHLNGVEEAHARALGAFIQTDDGELPAADVLRGADEAIKAMETWWRAMFSVLCG